MLVAGTAHAMPAPPRSAHGSRTQPSPARMRAKELLMKGMIGVVNRTRPSPKVRRL